MAKKYIELEKAIEAIVGLTTYDNAPALNAAVEKEYHNGREWIGGVRDALIEIGDLPAADVVEVRHGRWERIYDKSAGGPRLRCSLCHSRSLYAFYYCPDCGAKMDGGQDE